MFEESIKRFPNFLETYPNLANALVYKGNIDLAKKILNRAIELSPKYLKAYSSIAGIYVGEGNLKKRNYI